MKALSIPKMIANVSGIFHTRPKSKCCCLEPRTFISTCSNQYLFIRIQPPVPEGRVASGKGMRHAWVASRRGVLMTIVIVHGLLDCISQELRRIIATTPYISVEHTKETARQQKLCS